MTDKDSIFYITCDCSIISCIFTSIQLLNVSTTTILLKLPLQMELYLLDIDRLPPIREIADIGTIL